MQCDDFWKTVCNKAHILLRVAKSFIYEKVSYSILFFLSKKLFKNKFIIVDNYK